MASDRNPTAGNGGASGSVRATKQNGPEVKSARLTNQAARLAQFVGTIGSRSRRPGQRAFTTEVFKRTSHRPPPDSEVPSRVIYDDSGLHRLGSISQSRMGHWVAVGRRGQELGSFPHEREAIAAIRAGGAR